MHKAELTIIAETIRENRTQFGSNICHARFASEMAVTLARTNPRFDRQRFIMACMPTAWVGTNKSNCWERVARGGRTDAR